MISKAQHKELKIQQHEKKPSEIRMKIHAAI